ncbi:MAG: hypothetical protein ACFE0I_02345 [Elainellaceae cyanobacterium]
MIHSFWVPQFRLKQDAIPGQQTGLRFTATKEGTYPVVCAELCGSYHRGMRSQVVVHSQEEFDSWVEQSRVAQPHTSDRFMAATPMNLSVDEYLTPYAEMGLTPETLTQLHASHP